MGVSTGTLTHPDPLRIPRLAVACAPVVRSVANKQYSASDYEVSLPSHSEKQMYYFDVQVCLLQLHGDPAWAFPNACIDYDVDPLKAAFTEVEKQTTVKGIVMCWSESKIQYSTIFPLRLQRICTVC